MLFSANKQERNVLFLPEPFEDIDNLIKVITDNAGPVDKFISDCQASIGLYCLARKCNLIESHMHWIRALAARYVREDPFEFLAAACEAVPCDLWLATTAIKAIQPLAPNAFDDKTRSRQLRHLHPTSVTKLERTVGAVGSQSHANPALFSPAYIARLGVRQYSSFVNAWFVTSQDSGLSTAGNKELGEHILEHILERLARNFESRWAEWKV